MRGRWNGQLWAVLVLPLLLAAWPGKPVVAQGVGPSERLVLALYCADFEWSSWTGSRCDVPPDLYVSSDEATTARHVREAGDAGIDGLIQTWRGPSVAANLTAANFRTLLEQSAGAGLTAAVQVDLTSSLLDTTDEVRAALAVLRDELTRQAGYLSVGGRPVVFFVGQDVLSQGSWEALRGEIDPERRMIWIAEGTSTGLLAAFDGLYVMDVFRLVPPGLTLSQIGDQVRAWAQIHNASRLWVATTLPGYDDRLLVSVDQAYVLARNFGTTYCDSWASASASDPDWFLIRSFNEWNYCTHIERSVAFGDTYLTLTAEMVQRYRTPVTPTAEPTATTEPSTPEPPESPVVVTATPTITSTAEVSATMTATPTMTPVPTVTPFQLATPTPTEALLPTRTSPGIEPSMPATGDAPPTPGDVEASPAARPRPVVVGDEPRSCMVLPLLLTTLVCWGARKRQSD